VILDPHYLAFGSGGPDVANGLKSTPLDGWGQAVEFPVLGAGSRAPQRFIAGPENQLAVHSIDDFLRDQFHDDGACPYNPLVLYGPPGTGKSHLARGLCDAWKKSRPHDNVQCTSAGEFSTAYVEALDHGEYSAWRGSYVGAALLAIEDLSQLSGKQAAQGELIRIVDALLNAGGKLLITSRFAPTRLSTISAALASRLSAGLCVPLAPPGLEARRAIIDELATQRELHLTADAAQLLAKELIATAPELSGALHDLQSQVGPHKPVEVELVRDYLRVRATDRTPTLRGIAAHTARHFAVKVADLRSSSRRQSVVTARGMAMYLARQLTGGSLQHIGAYFGGRDHTTVSHGCRKTEALLRSDPATRHAHAQLRETLGSTAKS